MIAVLSLLFFLYILALHTSIAAMEMLSWLIFLLVVGVKLRRRDRFDFPLWRPLAALAAAVGVGLILNPPLRPFWFQFGFMRWIFLLWGFVWALDLVWGESFERRLLRVWSFALVVTAVYATFQFLTGIDLIRPEAHAVVREIDGVTYKATGFFSFSLTYAYMIGISYLALVGPATRKLSRVWSLPVFVTGPCGVVVGISRAAWIGLCVSGLTFVGVLRRRWLPIVAVVMAVLIGAVMLWVPIIRMKVMNLLEFHIDHSSAMRLHLWRAYFQMFADHPWFGVGLFQGDKLLPEYYQRLGIVEPFTSHAHNVPLQWLAGAGVFALLVYLYVAFYFLRLSWRLRSLSVWGLSLFCAQLYWHIGSLTEANFFDGEVNHFIVFTWALVLYLSRQPHLKVNNG